MTVYTVILFDNAPIWQAGYRQTTSLSMKASYEHVKQLSLKCLPTIIHVSTEEVEK